MGFCETRMQQQVKYSLYRVVKLYTILMHLRLNQILLEIPSDEFYPIGISFHEDEMMQCLNLV